jgi:hypothetical protein
MVEKTVMVQKPAARDQAPEQPSIIERKCPLEAGIFDKPPGRAVDSGSDYGELNVVI